MLKDILDVRSVAEALISALTTTIYQLLLFPLLILRSPVSGPTLLARAHRARPTAFISGRLCLLAGTVLAMLGPAAAPVAVHEALEAAKSGGWYQHLLLAVVDFVLIDLGIAAATGRLRLPERQQKITADAIRYAAYVALILIYVVVQSGLATSVLSAIRLNPFRWGSWFPVRSLSPLSVASIAVMALAAFPLLIFLYAAPVLAASRRVRAAMIGFSVLVLAFVAVVNQRLGAFLFAVFEEERYVETAVQLRVRQLLCRQLPDRSISVAAVIRSSGKSIVAYSREGLELDVHGASGAHSLPLTISRSGSEADRDFFSIPPKTELLVLARSKPIPEGSSVADKCTLRLRSQEGPPYVTLMPDRLNQAEVAPPDGP